MLQLSVNIDHVATIRQARRTWEPDPVQAATEALAGGADGITVHLREDRRHIQDDDVTRLSELGTFRLNLEMAATEEMVAFARVIRPQTVMLVPEGRTEITTEGGLNVAGQRDALAAVVDRLRGDEVQVSAFIDPDPLQVEACASCGFDICEIHTGPYAHAFHEHGRNAELSGVVHELEMVRTCCDLVRGEDMLCNAGHALNYSNILPLASIPGLYELHIGHSIVSRAVMAGMREAVAEMRDLLLDAAGVAHA